MRSDWVSVVRSAKYNTTAGVVSRSMRPRWWLLAAVALADLIGRWMLHPAIWWPLVAYQALLGLAMVKRTVGGWVWSRAPRWMCGKNQAGKRKACHVYDVLDFAGQMVWAGITGAMRHRLYGHITSERAVGRGVLRRVTTCRGQKAAERWERGRIMAARFCLGKRIVNTEEARPDDGRERAWLLLWWVPFHLSFGLVFPAARMWGMDQDALDQVIEAAA